MGAAKERTVAGMLARAAQIGAEMDAILGDVGLQKLSRNAWLGMAAELADGADLGGLRELIASMPYLNRVVHGTAAHWLRTGQDRPVPEGVFLNGEGEYAPSYAERIVAGLSVEQCSAVAAAIFAETAPPERWGRLGGFDEVPALIEPLRAELEQLDEELRASLLVADLRWEAGRPTLTAGGVTLVLNESSAGAVANAFAAEAARHHAATGRAQAAA